jgi:hypothetical protein
MKKTALGIIAIAAVIGTPALAADLALKAPPPPAPTWTGCYIVSGALSPSCAVWSDPEDVADLDWIGSHIWLTI